MKHLVFILLALIFSSITYGSALEKQTTLSNGAEGNYFKVMRLTIDYRHNITVAQVKLFKDITQYGANPDEGLLTKNYKFDKIVEGEDAVIAELKKLIDFAGALQKE